jgi:hypothetical protein
MRKLMLVLTLCAAAACGRIGLGNNENDVMIDFKNESTEQATLYVVPTSGEQIRLGMATAGATETFRVPESVAVRGSVTFAARMLARSETPTTGTVTIRPGDRYIVTLPSSRAALTVLPGD